MFSENKELTVKYLIEFFYFCDKELLNHPNLDKVEEYFRVIRMAWNNRLIRNDTKYIEKGFTQVKKNIVIFGLTLSDNHNELKRVIIDFDKLYVNLYDDIHYLGDNKLLAISYGNLVEVELNTYEEKIIANNVSKLVIMSEEKDSTRSVYLTDGKNSYNIHGETIYSSVRIIHRIGSNILMDKVNRQIVKYNNLYDRQDEQIINVSGLKNKVTYYPITYKENGVLSEGYKNYLFMYFKNTMRMYAYDWDTQLIHTVTLPHLLVNKEMFNKIFTNALIECSKRHLKLKCDSDNTFESIFGNSIFEYNHDIPDNFDKQMVKSVLMDYKIGSRANFNMVSFVINGQTSYIIEGAVSDLIDRYQEKYNGKEVNWRRESPDYYVDYNSYIASEDNNYKAILMALTKDIKKIIVDKGFKVNEEVVTKEDICLRENLRLRK